MASGNYVFQQQQPALAARIKTLINSDLKEICKAYGYQVSGNKAQLQPRCAEILQNIVKEGNGEALSEFEYRVHHHGKAPPPGYSAAAVNTQTGNSASYPHMSSNRLAPPPHRFSSTGRYFKASPFYEVLDTVLPIHELPEVPQNRNTIQAKLVLTADQAQRLRDDDSLRLLLYCGSSTGMSVNTPTDITFPNQLEVKINGDEVKHSYKGLKNKPGSTKPADVTDKIRKNTGYQNQISVTYALTTKRFSVLIYMARYVSAGKLIDRVKTGKIIPKQTVLDEMNRANADPDIAATSVRMSLKDPISTVRITIPVRSTVCTHNQCFDGAMFLQLQEQAPQWSCPVCSKSVPFESLCVDKYFEDILQRTASSIDKVDIEPNGEWTVIKEEEDSQTNGASRKRPRASYDDDFDDDDAIEIVDPAARPALGINHTNLRAISSAGNSLNTPPASSREPSVAQSVASAHRGPTKRPASAVIDLTLSDDDEPPRSAKRQTTSMHHGSSSQSLRLPPPPPPPPPPDHRAPYHHSGHTDIYRASTSSERTPSIGRSAAGDQSGFIRGRLNGENARQGNSASPTLYSHPSGGFVNFGSQPPSRSAASGSLQVDGPRFAGFALRPSAQCDPGSQQQPHGNGPLRLPPMQSPQPGGLYDGWRNEYGNHSSSPSGRE